jgi:hypothetical protein
MTAVWTPEEERAIRSLQRLADRWPRSLTLFSAAGSLFVLPTDHDPGRLHRFQAERISGIPNDGGDPDWCWEDCLLCREET